MLLVSLDGFLSGYIVLKKGDEALKTPGLLGIRFIKWRHWTPESRNNSKSFVFMTKLKNMGFFFMIGGALAIITSLLAILDLLAQKGLLSILVGSQAIGFLSCFPPFQWPFSGCLAQEEHQMFTNAWRSAIGYINSTNRVNTKTANTENIWKAAQYVYKDYPALLNATKQFLEIR
jgi:hypothetical protein